MSKYYKCTVSIKDSDTEKVPFKCHISGLSEKQKEEIETLKSTKANTKDEKSKVDNT